MSTDLKFSLVTTIIVLGLIVAVGLTAVVNENSNSTGIETSAL